MAYTRKTYIDLYVSEAEAIAYYKSLFPSTLLTDPQITSLLSLSFFKVEPIFGEFRNYEIGEDTKRNDDMKRAVSFEANSIALDNADASNIVNGGLNSGDGSNSNITEEKIGNITTKYGKGMSGTAGGNGSAIASILGLLSVDAGVLIARYIRKSYGWGMQVDTSVSV